MSSTYSVRIGDCALGYGPSPQAAWRDFWRQCWFWALDALTRPQPEWSWFDRECVRLCSEQQPWNWYRAVQSRASLWGRSGDSA